MKELKLPSFDRESIVGKRSLLEPFINQGKQSIDYAFLVHPRDPYDALACAKFFGFNLGALARLMPDRLEQSLKSKFLYNDLAKIPPFIIGDSLINVEGSSKKGALVAVLLYGEQMLANGWRSFAQDRIVEAIRLAKNHGAKLIGLGAHTSPATLGGEKLRKNYENGVVKYQDIQDIGITNGNAFTASANLQMIQELTARLELNPEQVKVGIVGAAGSVGHATTRLIVEHGFRYSVLIGSSKSQLERAFPDLADDVVFASSTQSLKTCDIVAVMTSGAKSTIKPEDILPGSIIIEDTQPRNISREQGLTMRKNGILAVDGGFVYIPGYRCGFNLRLPESTSFACLAETIILASENRRGDYSIGPAEVSKAKEMEILSRKYGIRLGDLSWYSEPIPQEGINKVLQKNLARRNGYKSIHQVMSLGHI